MMIVDQIREETRCRAGGGTLSDVLPLGIFVQSAFLRPDEADPPSYPLTLAIGEKSRLVQLRHTVNADNLYRNYWYRSGTNDMMVTHLRALVSEASKRVGLRSGDVALDIGCNDGTLLRAYGDNIRKVGFDPSNITPTGIDEFHNTYFMGQWEGRAKIVTSIAMFYDLPDPVQFARDVRSVLADDGLWVIEAHYLPTMLQTNGFDAICHEHLLYLDLHSLDYILKGADLFINDVTLNGVNGGSFRAYISKRPGLSAEARLLKRRERQPDFATFGERIEANRSAVRGLLDGAYNAGRLILGLGASTKGSTMAQYYGLTPRVIQAVSDRNPLKAGRVMSGTRLPVITEMDARSRRPYAYFVFPYHFLRGLREREHFFLKNGGKFIVPLPTAQVAGYGEMARLWTW